MALRWQLPHGGASKPAAGGRRSPAVQPTVLAIVVVMVVVLLAVLFGARWTPSGDAETWVSTGVRTVVNAVSNHRGGAFPTAPDRLLGGLLSPDFDDRSCLSRYRAALYRRRSFHYLSPHLVAKIRWYESIHRLCGPGTSAYERAVARLRSPPPANSTDGHGDAPSRCSYLVWSDLEGLGNRMLALVSAFLYALLTDRVLLFHTHGDDMDDLFCEPFPGSTWLLPDKDFPIRGIERFNDPPRETLGKMLLAMATGDAAPPPWVYVHLRHGYKGGNDHLFFCDDGQDFIRRVPWVVVRSDNYFAPALFLVPRHERELARLFPRPDTVFHHLGRYLFHPSNTVWGMVTRFHGSSYLADADERVGVQVRMFSWAPISTDDLYAQIVSCVHGQSILPRVPGGDGKANATAGDDPAAARRKAVLVVSLHGEYYERMRDMYYERGAAGGEAVISVFQPTHLGGQHSGEQRHNQKALAEIVLLSFSDVAVTTAASTFGYVSHGLAGLRPWVLMSAVGRKAPDPPCRRATTIEPCFHEPPQYDCRARADGDSGAVVRHIRHCEDFPQGVQLVE